MTRPIFTATMAAGLGLMTSPVWAITAEEVWLGLKAIAAETDRTVTSTSESLQGGVLTVSGLQVARSDDGMDIDGRLETLTLTENTDGSVTLSASDVYVIDFAVLPDEDERVEGTLTLNIADFDAVATDGDAGLRIDYTLPEVTAAMTTLESDNEDIEIDLAGLLSGLSGTFEGGRDGGPVAQSMAADRGSIKMSGTNPDGGGTFTFDMAVDEIASDSTGSMVFAMGNDDLAELLKDGLSTSGTASLGKTTFSVAFDDQGDSGSFAGGMTGVTVDVSLDGEAFVLDQTYSGFEFILTGSEIPLPQVTGAFGEWATGITMPLAPADDPLPFALRLLLGDVTMGDEVWSLFDPGAQLPRDPATLLIDVTGMVSLLGNLLDPEAMDNLDELVQPSSLQIGEVLLSMAGAALTANGALDVQEGGSGPGGMPPIEGIVNLNLKGGNGLLDTLVAMGLLPADQAMMARMMTGMIAKPGPGADELVSEIEFRADGTVLANGAPLPF